MKKILIGLLLLVSIQAWSQGDTLVEEDIRKIGDILYQQLDETVYGPSLLNRSFTTKEITLQQINGDYNQTHSIFEFFDLYQDIAYSYLDSNTLMNTETLANFITNEFKMNEYNSSVDQLVQPFGFLLHVVSAIDSNKFDLQHFQRDNYSLVPLVNETTLYSKKLLKSCALIEFSPESGYQTGFLKYTPELVSTSANISNLNLFINVGNGYMPFNASNSLIEYDRIGDSIIGSLAYNYQMNDSIYTDTLQFYLTTNGENKEKGVESDEKTTWDFTGGYENSTSIKFEIGAIYGCGNTHFLIRRPIIIVPPYRPGVQPVSMQKYFDQFNYSNLIVELTKKGYDVIFIKLKPGNESLELAAQALSEYITMTNEHKKDYYPDEDWENILMGYSMGGQISRYCLKKMEKDHMEYGAPHHHTRLYIPFDSPHLGANIPMFTQAVYKDLRFANIFAMMGYNSLVDGASSDMGASHIEGSLISEEDNGNGEPKIYHILPDITGERRDFVIDLHDHLNHQFTAPVGDMRRGFPAFTRNIAISTGANDQDYNDLYNLEPGKLLFHQSAIATGYALLHYKLRRIYASKRVYDHTVFRNKEQMLTFLIPITVKNRDYRVIYGDEFDLAQGGYKDEFYDKAPFFGLIPTGAVQILRTSAFGLGQKEYDNHMCFLPMVSALAINDDIWGLGNLFYNLKAEGLMFNQFDFTPDQDESDTYGYPNLGHPTDHFNITPFEAIYCDPQTYEHIKMDASIEENDNYDHTYLDYTAQFILDEVEAENVFLQNKIIGKNHVQWDPSYVYSAWYKAQNKLTIGNLVTPKTDPGDYVIEASGDITVYAGREINLKSGFHAMQGSEFHAYIDDDYDDCDPFARKSAQSTNNNSQNKNLSLSNDVYLQEENLNKEQFQISIYPNPSTSEITIIFPPNVEGSFEIINAVGTSIQKNTVPSEHKTIISLETGLYFLHFYANTGQNSTKQIIIL